uniref:Uncharacterized protein n=1 Tax=Arundo donax TaxID=35708 RepID=A0A0A8ZSI8_ARUDO
MLEIPISQTGLL